VGSTSSGTLETYPGLASQSGTFTTSRESVSAETSVPWIGTYSSRPNRRAYAAARAAAPQKVKPDENTTAHRV